MICLVRHTAVDVPAGVCYGRSDVPLRETFYDEAERVRAGLPRRFERVYTSPLSRCVRLAEHCGYADAVRDDRLMELDFGAWERQRWEDTGIATLWNGGWIDTPPPGGESLRRMYERVSSFFDALPRGEDVLIFTHGGVIHCARTYFGETSLEKAFDKPVGYGSMIAFEA